MVTQPEHNEPALNQAIPGEQSDTTTPHQLAIDLKAYTLGNVLTEDKRKQLIDWMSGNQMTDSLIRAAVPVEWKVSDKSGSGGYGTRNDIALITRCGQAPIILVVMTTHQSQEAKSDDALVVDAAKIAVAELLRQEK